MRFTGREIKELVISAVVIGFCFAWIVKDDRFFSSTNFIEIFAIMLIAVGSAFIFHEIAHKFTAQRYGCWAEYKIWETGLIAAFFLAVSPLHIVFAAPGAVYISCGHYGISRRENGIISVAGPLTNLILAVMFLSLESLSGFFYMLGKVGFLVNTWLALFNMIPFPPLDGSKVKAWDTKVWIGVIVGALVLMGRV